MSVLCRCSLSTKGVGWRKNRNTKLLVLVNPLQGHQPRSHCPESLCSGADPSWWSDCSLNERSLAHAITN